MEALIKDGEKFNEWVIRQVQIRMIMCIESLTPGRIRQSNFRVIGGILPVLGNFLSGGIKLREVKEKKGVKSGDLIGDLRESIKQMKTFNPKLAEEAEEILDEYGGVGEVIKPIAGDDKG